MPVGSPNPMVFLSPGALTKNHDLPVAAYLRTPTQPPGLDLSRPILLYSHYHSTKVRATSLRQHRDGTLSLVGPSLVIPDTYSGWFSVITPEGKSAPNFSTLEEVTSAKLSFFLTRYDVTGFSIKEEDSGKMSLQRIVVPSGHVLKSLGIIQDLNSRQNSNNNGNWLQRSSPQDGSKEEKFVQCLNFKNEMVFLPLTTKGKFYATAQKSSKNCNKVFLIPQLIKNFKLPQTVKLVCGNIPRIPCAFTGLLRLERSYQEDVILSCTMTSEASATLFEMDLASNFFLTPILDGMFTKSPIYLKTVSYCQDEADIWQRQIKVTHHVTEKRSRSLTRSMSNKLIEPLHSNSRALNLSFLSELNLKKLSKDRTSPYKNKFWDALNDKENKKKIDKKVRRLSKQNTYVFQTIKRQASQPFVNQTTESSNTKFSSRLSQSVDNLESKTFVGEISSIPADLRQDYDDLEESHYSVIGEPPLKREKSQDTKEISTISELLPELSPNTSEFSHENDDVCKKMANYSHNENNSYVSSDILEIKPVINIYDESECETVSLISVSTSEKESINSSGYGQSKSGCDVFSINEEPKNETSSPVDEQSGVKNETNNSLTDEENKRFNCRESNEAIQMRGNTVVIKVKDLEIKKPLNQIDDECIISETESDKINTEIQQNKVHTFKSTVEFTINPKSKELIDNLKVTDNYNNCPPGNCKITPQESNLKLISDLASKTSEGTISQEYINNDNAFLGLPETVNSVNSSKTEHQLSMGVCQNERLTPDTSTTNKDASIYNRGVLQHTSPDTQQSDKHKTLFCITHDIPKNHIFHTIDLSDLRNDETLLKLTECIENSKLNPIFLIKNEGNVSFSTCTDEGNNFSYSSMSRNNGNVTNNKKDSKKEERCEDASEVIYKAEKCDVIEEDPFDVDKNTETFSSDDSEGEVTYI